MRYWFLAAVVVVVCGCSHPLEISGKGDILSDSGTRDCTYEQFSLHTDPQTDACPNFVVGHYFETYTAAPKPGWIFSGWTGCGSPTHQCTFNVAASLVNAFIGSTAAPLIANFEQRYTFERVAYRILQAKYNRSRDLLVLLADDDHLYLYDVSSHTTTRVYLGRPGSHLSVSPDGNHAIVAHNSYLSHIDLLSGTVITTYPLAKFLHDVELDDRGFVHIMENTDSLPRLKTMDLATGDIFDATGSLAGYPTYMDIHQSGDLVYGVSTYSNILAKYDISNGIAEQLDWTTTPSANRHCNNLWLSDDGQNMFTACGSVFFTSESAETDMSLNGELYLPQPPYSFPQQRIAHLSQFGNEVLYVSTELADRVEVHQYNPIVYQGERSLPEVTVAEQDFQTYGRFVFHTSTGEYIVVAEIEDASGLDYNYGIVRETPLDPGINVRPSAITEKVLYADTGEIPLDGSKSFDPEGKPLIYTWQLLSAPAGSAAHVISPADSQTSFVADLPGSYLFSLVTNDGTQDSEPDFLEVVAEDPGLKFSVPLNFLLEDAEYSLSLDRLVMVASAPSRIIQYDLANGTFHSTLLPFPAETVSITPDGGFAAVGHSADQRVSILNLQTETVAATYFSTTGITDLVFAGNGYLHIFPSTGQHTNIYSMNIFTGQITQSTGGSVRERTKADLHPSGNYVYGADNGVSPDDIEIYAISAGPAHRLADSPYHGDYEFCGDIWVSESGNHLFTRCGNVYNASPNTAEDMTFAGWLDAPDRIKSLSNSGDEVALVTDLVSWDPSRAYRLRLFSFDQRKNVRDIALPSFEVDGTTYPGHGRHVFHDASGSTLLVLVQADEDAELLFGTRLYVHGR